MRIVIEASPEAAARRAAARVAALVRERPSCVLALPAGATPQAMYAELARLHREEGLDFGHATTFNLDEYLGLAGDDPRSFRARIREDFLDAVNVAHANALDGATDDPARECARYEAAIAGAGGLDLAILGIGSDGHIGFNEPGSSLGSRTRVKTLTAETARANAAHFPSSEAVPRVALTMGVGTIRDAHACLLVATGAAKAEAVQATVEGPVTAQVTASALQLHPTVDVIVDEDAAAKLERLDYYKEMESAQTTLEGT